jgi:hypothetical protein
LPGKFATQMAVMSGRRAERVPQYCGSPSKSHTMKALVLAALLLPPIGAAAVSPEEAYLAARDRYIASFNATASASSLGTTRPSGISSSG